MNDLNIDKTSYKYFNVSALGEKFEKLPFCLRILVECLLRKYHQTSDKDISKVWKDSLDKILNYNKNLSKEILFQPSRVLLQDFTGITALVDLSALRDVVVEKGGNPEFIDSECPADLVVDHTIQLDYNQVFGLSKSKKKDKDQLKHDQSKCENNLILPSTIVFESIFNHLSNSTSYKDVNQSFYSPQQYGSYLHSKNIYPVAQYFSLPHQFCIKNQHNVLSSSTTRRCSSNIQNELPIDNPGLPIQNKICPFHQRMSFWYEQLEKNQEFEFKRNSERFEFLKWVNQAFKNITVIPPGTGVMHQINLEYLARIVSCKDGSLLFPDSLIGTDNHTTMINGLGVLGWCVGTMDAESVMFGHPISFSIPKVIGVKLFGDVPQYVTSTELVLLITKRLRHTGVGGSFVEFTGPGVKELSVADRTTISSMCPEYGAIIGFFPTDEVTIQYLEQTGRDKQKVDCIKRYLKAINIFKNSSMSEKIEYSSVIEINFAEVQPCLSGPKRSKDKVLVQKVASEFKFNLTTQIKEASGFGLLQEETRRTFLVNIDDVFYTLTHGSIVLVEITSCSNTSNPSVMLGAGILAKKAIEAGLSVPKYLKTTLAPGSGVITSYLQESGVMPYLYMLGFEIVGYGCSTCVENNKPLSQALIDAVTQSNLICCGVLSGNRNFDRRIQPEIKANYLASPMLAISYALAGRIDIDFRKDPIGYSKENKPIFLSSIWPSRKEIKKIENDLVIPAIFRQVYSRVSYGNKYWSAIKSSKSKLFSWKSCSTYIKSPLYIKEICKDLFLPPSQKLKKMRCLLKLGDNITSDYISPAGSIVRNSPAAEYLSSIGLNPREYFSYGSRRGNSQVMMRGTFAHIKLENKLNNKKGPYTKHFPSEVPTTIFDASQRYKKEGVSLYAIAGENFGRGSPRDWATKGPFLLGIRAVLAISFAPTYRANLVKTGILPVEIDKTTYEILTGIEEIDIEMSNMNEDILIKLNGEFDLKARAKINNYYEWSIFNDGGILRQLLTKSLHEKV